MPEQEESETHRKIWFAASVFLIVLGIVFYWTWGVMFNTWNIFEVESLGAYVITVLLLSFGIIGALLTKKKK
ncbi:MAG: hypothetical protein OEV21_02755 [Thermoplasmata archaeon]|nr:hypothetical protein [Thermoplasmata archaeon]